jgi:hypothetical protein
MTTGAGKRTKAAYEEYVLGEPARSSASFIPAPYSAALSRKRTGPLIFSMWILPSWTGSTVLASSRNHSCPPVRAGVFLYPSFEATILSATN